MFKLISYRLISILMFFIVSCLLYTPVITYFLYCLFCLCMFLCHLLLICFDFIRFLCNYYQISSLWFS